MFTTARDGPTLEVWTFFHHTVPPKKNPKQKKSEVAKLPSGAHGVVVSHPLRMRKALGSIPSVSMCRNISELKLHPDHGITIDKALQEGPFTALGKYLPSRTDVVFP